MTQFRLKAVGLLEHPEILPLKFESKDSQPAQVGHRQIFVDAQSKLVECPIYDFNLLKCGNTIKGPAVIHTPITTIVLQQSQIAHYDEFRNIVIEFQDGSGQ